MPCTFFSVLYGYITLGEFDQACMDEAEYAITDLEVSNSEALNDRAIQCPTHHRRSIIVLKATKIDHGKFLHILQK